MRLVKDVSGTFDQAKDSLQRDLITIQNAFDELEQRVVVSGGDITSLKKQLANPTVTIAPNGQVMGRPGDPLKTVAHDQTMFGEGTAKNPLVVNSNYIIGLIPGSGTVSVFDQIFSVAQISALFATPATIVAGTANTFIVPVCWSLLYTKNNQSWGTGQTLRLKTAHGDNLLLPDLGLGFNDAAVKSVVSGQGSTNFSLSTAAGQFALGDALQVTTNGSLGASGTFAFTAGLRLRVIYTVVGF